jgi:hypothetical protein
MPRNLKLIIVDTESIVKNVEGADYALAGQLRAAFTKKNQHTVVLMATEKTELVWEEREYPNAVHETTT